MDIQISKEILPYLYTMKDGETITEKTNLSLILGLFASKAVTLEKAAELSGKNIWDFIDILKKYQIPWGEYTEDSMLMDNNTMTKIAEGAYE